jgi:prephenate dehydrogenase
MSGARKQTLGLIGFGAFGRFMAAHLRANFDVVAADRENIACQAAALGIRAANITEAAHAPIVVLAVPAQHLEGALRDIRAHIQPGAIVLDVCSVKLKPLALMEGVLPMHASIIGTHPLFGPQSGKDGIAGLPIALCPLRAAPEQIACVRAFLADTLKLRVIDTTPDAHDREMANVQALTHLLSRALTELDLPESDLATVAYQRLLAMRANLRHDSEDLFRTIQRENPYAEAARRALREKLDEIEARIHAPT